MVALPQESTRMTEAEYLDFERASETKHEYIDGHVYEMAGVNARHVLISSYTAASLGIQSQGRPFAVYSSLMRIKVKATSFYTYADICVVSGKAQVEGIEQDNLLNPIIIVEVLSAATEGYDRGKKFQQYRQLESIQEYLIVEQEKPHIEHYLRQPDNTWLLADAVGLDASLELPSIGCTLKLEDVYQKVTFEADENIAAQ